VPGRRSIGISRGGQLPIDVRDLQGQAGYVCDHRENGRSVEVGKVILPVLVDTDAEGVDGLPAVVGERADDNAGVLTGLDDLVEQGHQGPRMLHPCAG
jgi:hypothetical protein